MNYPHKAKKKPPGTAEVNNYSHVERDARSENVWMCYA